VLTKGDVAVDECGFDGRKFSGSQVPFAEELVDWPDADRTVSLLGSREPTLL
jgi:hypothetical protein